MPTLCTHQSNEENSKISVKKENFEEKMEEEKVDLNGTMTGELSVREK